MSCMEDAGSVGPSSRLRTVEPLPRSLLSRLKRLCSFGACLCMNGSNQAREADQSSPQPTRKARPNLVLFDEGGENDTDFCANAAMFTIHASIPGREDDALVACGGAQPLAPCAHKFDQPPAVLVSQPLSPGLASHISQRASSSKLDSDAAIASPNSAANAATSQDCHSCYVTPYLAKPDSGRAHAQHKPTAPDNSTYIDLPTICTSPGPVSPMLVREARRLAPPPPPADSNAQGYTENCSADPLPVAPSLGLTSTCSDTSPGPCRRSPTKTGLAARPCSNPWPASLDHHPAPAHPTKPRASPSPERPPHPPASSTLTIPTTPTHLPANCPVATNSPSPPPSPREPPPPLHATSLPPHHLLASFSPWRQSGTDPGCLLEPPAARQERPIPAKPFRGSRVGGPTVIAVPVAAAEAAGPLLGTSVRTHDVVAVVTNSSISAQRRPSVSGPLPPCRLGAGCWEGGDLPPGYGDPGVSGRSRRMGSALSGVRSSSRARGGLQDILPQNVSCLASVSYVSGAGSLTLPLETGSLCDMMAPQTGQVAEHTALELGALAPALDLWAVGTQVALQSRIARGAYGVVYRGLWHGCACAVKLMLAGSAENLSSQLTEVFLCKALSCHPNIVQTFDCHVYRITGETWHVVQQLAAASAGGSGGGGGGGSGIGVRGGSVSDNPGRRLIGTAAMATTLASAAGAGTPGDSAAAQQSTTRDESMAELLVPRRHGSVPAQASPPLTLDLSPSSTACDRARIGVSAMLANALSFGTAVATAARPQSDLSTNITAPAPCVLPVSGSACSPPAAVEILSSLYDNKPYLRSLPVAAPAPVGSTAAALEGRVAHMGRSASAACQDDTGSNDSRTGGNSQAAASLMSLYDRSPFRLPSFPDGPTPPLGLIPLPPLPSDAAQRKTLAARSATAAVAGLPPEGPPTAGPPPDLGRVSEELGTVNSLNEAASAGLSTAVQPPPLKRRPPAESLVLVRDPPDFVMTRDRVLSEVTATQLRAQSPLPPLQLPQRPSSPALAAATAVAAAAVHGCSGGSGALQAGMKRLMDRSPSRTRTTGCGGAGGGCGGSGDGGSAISAACGSRPVSSATSRGLMDGCWPTPDSSTRGPSSVPPVSRTNSQSHSPQPRSGHGDGGGVSSLGAAAVACFPLVSAGMTSAMVFGMGMAHSPASSGLLPATREQQAGSAYGSGMGSGYGSGMGSGYGLWFGTGHYQLPMSAGGATGGAGSLGRTLGPPPLLPPLYTRSAVSTGDDGDVAEAAAGARNLAQALHQLGAREGQLAVLLVMEECDRGSLHNLLSKAASAAAAAAAHAPTPMQQQPPQQQQQQEQQHQQQQQQQQAGCAASGGWSGSDWRRLYSPFAGGGRYGIAAALRALVATSREVALGMAFLHVNNIIHGDLKPGNVLLRSSRQDQRGFVVKISDFGLSRVMNPVVPPHYNPLNFGMMTSGDASGGFGGPEEGGEQHGGGGGLCGGGDEYAGLAGCRCRRGGGGGGPDGTVPYMAPEIINENQRSKATDVWAYGVLLWQLVTGKWPYEDLLPVQIMAAVCSGEQLLMWPSEAHSELVQLGRSCLSYNPRERPSFAQIVRRLSALESELAPR